KAMAPEAVLQIRRHIVRQCVFKLKRRIVSVHRLEVGCEYGDARRSYEKWIRRGQKTGKLGRPCVRPRYNVAEQTPAVDQVCVLGAGEARRVEIHSISAAQCGLTAARWRPRKAEAWGEIIQIIVDLSRQRIWSLGIERGIEQRLVANARVQRECW